LPDYETGADEYLSDVSFSRCQSTTRATQKSIEYSRER